MKTPGFIAKRKIYDLPTNFSNEWASPATARINLNMAISWHLRMNFPGHKDMRCCIILVIFMTGGAVEEKKIVRCTKLWNRWNSKMLTVRSWIKETGSYICKKFSLP